MVDGDLPRENTYKAVDDDLSEDSDMVVDEDLPEDLSTEDS